MKFATKSTKIFQHTLTTLLRSWEIKRSKFAANKEKNANKFTNFYIHPFDVTSLLTYYLLNYYFNLILIFFERAYCFT